METRMLPPAERGPMATSTTTPLSSADAPPASPTHAGPDGDATAHLGRDAAIDRLRGLCLVSMTVGHLAYAGTASSPLDAVVHAPVWVSGAAGFVFLSGVSVALFSRARGGPSRTVRRWMLGRALFLAAIAVVLNLAGVAWFEVVGRPHWFPMVDPDPVAMASGRWWLPATDVLVVYAVFLAMVAMAGRWPQRAPGWSLAASAGMYVLATMLPDVGPTKSPGRPPVWDLPGWQVVFVAGLVAGWNWPTVRAFVDRHRRAVLIAGAAGVALIAGLRLGFNVAERGIDPLGLLELRDGDLGWALDKESLGPLRLLLIGLLGSAAYVLARRRLPADRLLTAAGARSLRVYTSSMLTMFAWPLLTGRIPFPLTELAMVAATVAVLATGLMPAVGRGRPWSI